MNDPALHVTVHRDVVLLRVLGDLDHVTAERLSEEALEAVAGGGAVVVDLTDAPFVDSGGMRLIDRLARAAGERGGAIRVVAPAGGAARFALQVSGFPDALVDPTMRAAVAVVGDPA